MSNYQNHVIDPTYFYDAIEQFAFDYDAYIATGTTVNNKGETVRTYTTKTIRGSLQSKGTRLVKSKEGNIYVKEYDFYCKSLFRISNGDFINYKNNYLRVDNVDDYDEYGVRSCHLTMIKLTNYKDLQEYIKYLNGTKLV